MAMNRHHRILLLALALSHSVVGDASSFSKYHVHSAFVPSSTQSPFAVATKQGAHHQLTPLTSLTPQRQRLLHANNYSNKQLTVNYFFPREKQQQVDESDISNNNEKTLQLPSIVDGQSSFTKYGRPQDINESSFGPLLPIAEAVDEATGGWGLSYADLHPATPRTTVGQAFLATNFFYAAAGLWLGFKGDWFYGGLTELAGVVSFIYHYTQLEFGKNRSEVRLALLIDYFCAGAALITGGVYMIQAGITTVPIDALLAAGGAVICLSLCWVWEFGYPYIFWHSLWHILSAYTGFLVGQEHLSNIAG